MKKNKNLIVMGLVVFILIYVLISKFTKISDNSMVSNVLVFALTIFTGIYIIKLLLFDDNSESFREKLFNLLENNSDTVYIMLSDNNNILYISSNLEEMLGTNFDELYNGLIKPELKNWTQKNLYVGQMIEYGNPKYNCNMWIRIKAQLYKDKKHEYNVIQVIDVTKEHEKQHLLITQATDIKTRENQLNQITEKSYDFQININVINNTYDLKYFKSDNLYFGDQKRGIYTEGLKSIIEKYINKNDQDLLVHNLSLDSLKEHFEKYELETLNLRYRVGNEIKNNIWLESTVFFLAGKNKNIVTILTKNVTENAENIREQNVLLQNTLNDLRQTDKLKNNLISTISHDIRIPLSNIIGLSDSLLENKVDSKVKEDIKSINDSSKEVLSIIDNLLDTNKLEKKIIEKEEKRYSVLKMFQKVLDNTKEYIGNKQIDIKLNMDKNLPLVLYGDFKRITQAICKITDNSVKYTKEGEIVINVRGEKKLDKVKLIVEINDTGMGITSERLHSIIENNSNNGISVVKELMKLLDGTFEIESNPEEYTKVTLSFMQKIVEDNKIREVIANNKIAEEFDLTGKKILIVDDNVLNLKVTSKLLSKFNLDVTLLESGNECIELVKGGSKFDLIFLDQMMPGIDGITTLNKLKELSDFDTPVVVLTADAMSGKKEMYLKNGFNDYISKPINKVELSRILKKYVKDA